MKAKTIILAALAGLSLLAGSARAQIIASDDFSYANGNLAGNSGGTGWAAAWANQTGTPTVVDGQANINSSAGQEAVRTLSAAQAKSSGSTLWIRFAGQQFTTSSGSTTTYGGFDLYDGGTEKLLIGKSWPGNYVWKIGLGGTLTVSTNSTLTPSVVYARVQFNASGNDQVDVWLNPTDPANIVNSNVTASATQSYADLSFDRIRLRGGISGSMTESWKFDNIAVGATLADVAVPPSPVITSQPVSVSGYPGLVANVTFSVQVAGNQPLVYQWRTNNVNLVNSGNVSGATSNVLTITGITYANVATNYYCIVTNNLGSATSSVVSLVLLSSPTFSAQTPATNSFSVLATNLISVQIQEGSLLNTNAIAMALDGVPVTPLVITQDTNTYLATVSYQPVLPMSAGATHAVQVKMTDTLSASYTNSWSFTTAFAMLPATLAGRIGPMSTALDAGITIFSTNDAWLGANYNASSSRTLYTRFSMAFNDVNGEIGLGGCFGGLEFYQGATEHLLIGNNWNALTWSLTPPDTDLSPLTLVALDEWHTMVVRTDLSPNNNATVTVWLDPDFTKTEANQPNAPVVVSTPNTFDSIHLRCGTDTASATFSNIIMAATSTDVGFATPVAPQFENLVPGVNQTLVPVTTPIGLQVVVGSVGIHTNAITLMVDGNSATPAFSIAGNIITVNYQPGVSFAAGSTHTNMVSLTDTNGTPYSTSWSFTVDPYPALPVNLEGPITVSGGVDTTIFTSQYGWIGGHYGGTSTNTLYARFSMEFDNLNGKIDTNGGSFGGLEFFLGNTERVLVGNQWYSTNWSLTQGPNGFDPLDLTPVTPVMLSEWHTMVVKSVYTSGTNAAVTVWLDPDFTKTEANQSNAPLVLSVDNTFDNIRLRCGNGTASAQFSNIVMAATAPGVGFAAAPAPAVLSIQKLGGNVQVSWTSTGTLQEAAAVTGPWTDSANQANSQTRGATNSALFFRVRQ